MYEGSGGGWYWECWRDGLLVGKESMVVFGLEFLVCWVSIYLCGIFDGKWEVEMGGRLCMIGVWRNGFESVGCVSRLVE